VRVAAAHVALDYDHWMRDPRLVEIDFLMDLERHEKLLVQCSGWREAEAYLATGDADSVNEEAELHIVAEGHARLYGTDARRFRGMINSLLADGLIAGWEMTGGYPISAHTNLPEGFPNQQFHIQINHSGRVHLWNLRDALLRDPDLEPFGLRSRAAWDRDLFVKLRWATPAAPLSVIFLDLDNFGTVNKKYGHEVGDAVLRATFQLVRSAVGVRGDVYRCGGEEVGVLLPATPADSARLIAEEIRVLIAREVHTQVEKLTTPQTASIGVTSFDHVIKNEAALAEVDTLMRAAKQAGKDRVEYSA
jgi:diguanylate cyclase (GGDEF)-like protein